MSHICDRNITYVSIPLLEQRKWNSSYVSDRKMSQLSHRNISRNISPLSTSGPAWKRSYVLAPTRIEKRTTISTNISQLLFLLERFIEIADMAWRILRALKAIQPLQCGTGWCSAWATTLYSSSQPRAGLLLLLCARTTYPHGQSTWQRQRPAAQHAWWQPQSERNG